MKQLISTLALFASLAGGFSAIAGQVKTHEATINVSEAYIPGGFSTETDAYVVVSGMFQNSCYTFNRAEVTEKGQQVHEIRSFATVSEQMCLMVMVPYQHEVRLGKLSAGEHTLRFINGDNTFFERKLVVE